MDNNTDPDKLLSHPDKHLLCPETEHYEKEEQISSRSAPVKSNFHILRVVSVFCLPDCSTSGLRFASGNCSETLFSAVCGISASCGKAVSSGADAIRLSHCLKVPVPAIVQAQ